MALYNGLLYNPDVEMIPGSNAGIGGDVFVPMDNESEYGPPVPPTPTIPQLDDLDASNTISRILDGWTKDLSTDGGSPGVVYHDTAPVEQPPVPAQRTKTVYEQTQLVISRFDQQYLQSLYDDGATFYVVYTDETRDQVSMAEITDPHPDQTVRLQIETEQIAKAINQNFWTDTNGVHVTESTKKEWDDAADDNWSDWPETPYYNILMNSLGILLRTQLINLSSWSRSGIAFYDGEGNAASNIVASFGKDGSLLRANGRDVMRVTPTGVVFVPLEGNEVSVTMITDTLSNLQNELDEDMTSVNQTLARIQDQIDGVVDTYYEEVDPEYDVDLTDENDAVIGDENDDAIDMHVMTPWMYTWLTSDEKAAHEGDLYYNILTGHAWRWLYVDDVWQWYRIADSDVAEALRIARQANTLAGTKKRVFTTTPTVPYDIGDLWVSGSTVKYATIAKATGQSYAESDWSVTATDDTTANTALAKANTNATNITSLQGEVVVIKRDYVTNATYTQNNAVWAANLTALDTSLKAYSDGAVAQEVTNRNTAISASATNVLSQVSDTYQVKGNYATTTDLSNEVTARNTAISQSASGVLQTVSETYATQQSLGTYVSQTSNDITTIIGDLDTVRSVVYQQEEKQIATDQKLSEKNNAYYLTVDPYYEESITDENDDTIVDESSDDIKSYVFSASNPVFDWNSQAERNEHVGDQYYNTLTGHMWRYNSSYIWEYVENKDATDALDIATTLNNTLPSQIDSAVTQARNASQAATNATTAAAEKKRVFTVTPTPPYDVGDLWVRGNQVMYAATAKAAGASYVLSDWVKTATDDSALDTYKTEVATIIRETSAGVLVAKSGASIGTVQAASNFKVVGINSWSGATPTIGATYALFGANGLSVYDNSGSNVLSFIGVQNNLPFCQIGQSTKGNVQIGVSSGGYGYVDFYSNGALLGHLGYEPGTSGSGSSVVAPYYTFGERELVDDNDNPIAVGNYSFATGYKPVASGYCSFAAGRKCIASGLSAFAEGMSTEASGDWSHAEGDETKAIGSVSHAEGRYATASGTQSHAEGYGSNASGSVSHAEGYSSNASASYSHAEGRYTTASGAQSHAEGYYTTASGKYSHASGYYVNADEDYQTAIGKYNKSVSDALFMVGNGVSSARKNAFTVLSSGNCYYAGTSTSNGTTITSDERIKTLIEELNPSYSAEFIKSLKPKLFYKEEGNENGELGFYAQEVEKTAYGKQLVTKDNSGVYDLPDFRILNYEGLIAPVVSALQDALHRIDELEERLKERK